MRKIFDQKSKIFPLQIGKTFESPHFKNLENSANWSSGQEEDNSENPAGFFSRQESENFSLGVRKHNKIEKMFPNKTVKDYSRHRDWNIWQLVVFCSRKTEIFMLKVLTFLHREKNVTKVFFPQIIPPERKNSRLRILTKVLTKV